MADTRTAERVLKDFKVWISRRGRDCGVPYSCLSYEIDRYLKETAELP